MAFPEQGVGGIADHLTRGGVDEFFRGTREVAHHGVKHRIHTLLRPPQHTTSTITSSRIIAVIRTTTITTMRIVVLVVGIISVVVPTSVSTVAARVITIPTILMSRGISGVGVDGDLA